MIRLADLKSSIFLALIFLGSNCYGEKEGSMLFSADYVANVYQSGLRRLTSNAFSHNCKKSIEFEYMKYFLALAHETPMPFEDEFFHTQCTRTETAQISQDPLLPLYLKAYPPKPSYDTPPIPDLSPIPAENIAILYLILVHSHPELVMRLIDALSESQHTFVVHVDLKFADVRHKLSTFATGRENIFILEDENSVSVTWGGFSVVNATIQGMKYAWLLDRPFDYLQLLSGTSYPIKSNHAIRTELSQQPGGIYMDVVEEPSLPHESMWFHYVECDDRLHRIHRMSIIRGMHMYVGSQWFTLPRHVVQWLLQDSLPKHYQSYAQFVVIADENYFATLISNSPYCNDIIRKKNLFLIFDKWENELSSVGERDPRKCLSPDPDHCGRSPSTLTSKFKSLLDVSRATFARKFDPLDSESLQLLDEIDRWRKEPLKVNVRDEGQHIMIRSSALTYRNGDRRINRSVEDRSTRTNCQSAEIAETNPATVEIETGGYAVSQSPEVPEFDYCWEISAIGQPLTLNVCDSSKPSQWFALGRCTENSNVTFVDGGHTVAQKGQEEMFCQLENNSGDLCVDLGGGNPNTGSPLIAWECSGQWNQLFRFMPNGTISMIQPEVVRRVLGLGSQSVTLCLEVKTSQSNELKLFPAECRPQINPLVQVFLYRNATLTSTERITQRRRELQSFDFLLRNGESQRAYKT